MFVNGFDEEMADYCCVADWKALGRMALIFHGNAPSIFPGNPFFYYYLLFHYYHASYISIFFNYFNLSF